MNKKLLIFLPFLLIIAGMFTSCEEVEETGKYDNWRERNEAYIDSLKALKPVIVATEQQALDIPVGTLFAIQVQTASTVNNTYYTYCKKITANTTGIRPLYTSGVSVFYYGTLINGESFQGNFKGYSLLDKTFSGDKKPTEFDSPTNMAVEGYLWAAAMQYMREGERWMMYIPYQAGYGASDNGGIPGYSTLGFDVQLEKVVLY